MYVPLKRISNDWKSRLFIIQFDNVERRIGLNNVEVLPIDDLMGNVYELILILQFVVSLLCDDKLGYVGGVVELVRLVSAEQKQSHFFAFK